MLKTYNSAALDERQKQSVAGSPSSFLAEKVVSERRKSWPFGEDAE
jgi:hypothetical protein